MKKCADKPTHDGGKCGTPASLRGGKVPKGQGDGNKLAFHNALHISSQKNLTRTSKTIFFLVLVIFLLFSVKGLRVLKRFLNSRGFSTNLGCFLIKSPDRRLSTENADRMNLVEGLMKQYTK